MAKTKNALSQLPDNKEAALEAALVSLEKDFGKGIIITGSSSFPEIERLSSGCLSLDRALSGGFPRGRIIELSGMESAGKSSVALHTVAECQKQGGICAYIDAEHALDVEYAAALGVDVPKLLISQPDNGEQALNITETLARTGAIHLIVVDSVAALVPRAETEGDIGDSSIGLQARLLSQAMRMLTSCIHKSNTTLMLINQIRMKIGVMFGSPEVTSGGNAIKFFASQRLDIRRIETITEGEEKTGIRSRIKVVKNKVGPPFRTAEFNIIFGKGIDWAMDLLDVAVEVGVIKKSGAWYSFGSEQIGQGSTKTAERLRTDPELSEKVRSLIS